MADKDTTGGPERSDLDPFAELTKIMGFDPRVPASKQTKGQPSADAEREAAVAKAAVEADAPAADVPLDDFHLDLEKELLGDLPSIEPVSAAEPEPIRPIAAVADERDELVQEEPAPYVRAEPEAEPVSLASEPGIAPAVEAEIYAQPEFSVEEQQAAELDDEPVDLPPIPLSTHLIAAPAEIADVDPVADATDDAADEDWDAILAGHMDDAFTSSVPVAVEAIEAEEALDVVAEDAIDIEASLEEAFAADEPVASEAELDPNPAFAEIRTAELADEPVFEAVEAIEDQPIEVAAPITAELEDISEAVGELSMDHAPVDEWQPAAFPEARAAEPSYRPAYSPEVVADEFDKPVEASMASIDTDFASSEAVAYQPASQDENLEDEYNALLGNNSKPQEPVTRVAAASAIHDPVSERAASIVAGAWKRVTPLQTNVDEPAAPAAEATDDFDLSFDEAVGSADLDDAMDQELAAALASHDLALDDDLSGQPVEEPKPVEAAAALPTPTKEDPFAALAAMAAKYQVQSSVSAAPAVPHPSTSSYVPASERPTVSARAAAPAPDIETIDVQDHAVVLADDLQLPEVPYEEPRLQSFDELDAEFEALLSEMSTGDTRTAAAAATARAYEAAEAPIRREPVAAPTHPAYVEQRPVYEQRMPQTPMQPPAAPSHTRYGQDDALDDFDEAYFQDSIDAFENGEEDMMPVAQARHRGFETQGRGPRRGLVIAAIVGGLALIGGISAVAMSFGGNAQNEVAFIKADQKPVKVRPAVPIETTAPAQSGSVYETVSREKGNEGAGQERLVNTAEEAIELPAPDDEEVNSIADAETTTIEEVAGGEGVANSDEIAKGEDRIEPVAEVDVAQNQDMIAVAPRKVRTMVVKSDGTMVPREEPAAAVAEEITTGATESAPAAGEVVASAEAAPKAVEPAPAGSWAVQISSQPSEEGANKSLKDISRKYAGVLGERGAAIVKAEVNGKTMWRVRVAAGSRDEAVNLCGNLKSAGGSCFVTK